MTLAAPRYNYGSCFLDRESGYVFSAHHPQSDPELWRKYLDGAEKRYAAFGVESALRREELEDGGTCSLFWLALEGPEAVAGIRCHGPLASAQEACALHELGAHPRIDEITAVIEGWIPDGLVEIKGAWVGEDVVPGLSEALARCHVHSMDWFGCRSAMCTCATHVAARWAAAGGRKLEGFEPVPYPDDRYETVLLRWDRLTLTRCMHDRQLERVTLEAQELAEGRERKYFEPWIDDEHGENGGNGGNGGNSGSGT